MNEKNMLMKESLTLSELLPSDHYAYQNEEILNRCKEATVAFISRKGTIFTHTLTDSFLDVLIDFYIETENKVPTIKTVTPAVIESVLQQNNDVLLGDISEASQTSEFDEDSEQNSIAEIDFNQLLNLSYIEQVADIHITIMHNGTLVRGRGSNGLYRLHKVMRNRDYGTSLGNQIFQVLASEGASGSFYESEPDENRFSWTVGGKVRNYRASTMPIKGGCKINVRCLDPYSDSILTPNELGFLPNQISLLLSLMHKPYGGLLISGQTGSGKTTTLMSLLDVLPDNINIHTIEDPVEWINSKFSQTEINMDGSKDEYGIYRGSFADYGKRLLRQDIDVAMFGELRDELSCSIFYRLASTGHMAVGTVHTGSAVGCITMLIEFFKLNPAQVADSDAFNAFLNQKLANKICPKCAHTHAEHKSIIQEKADKAELSGNFEAKWHIGKMMDEIRLVESFCHSESDYSLLRYRNSEGCDHCRHSGFKGKTVIAEILVLDTQIRDYIQRRDLLGIHKYLESVNYQTTRDHAIQKISAGLIDIHEACRLINDMDISSKNSYNYTLIANEMACFGKPQLEVQGL